MPTGKERISQIVFSHCLKMTGKKSGQSICTDAMPICGENQNHLIMRGLRKQWVSGFF